MKKKITAFEYNDHRDLIRALLQEKGFSYRSFAAKHGDIASFDLLASALSRGRTGTKNKPRRDFSPITLTRLGKTLKLSDEECTYLALLKLENDAEVAPGPHGNIYKECLQRLIREHKVRQPMSTNRPHSAKSSYSETANTVAKLLDTLPAMRKAKFAQEILSEARVALARQRHKPGAKALSAVIDRLKELVDLGAP